MGEKEIIEGLKNKDNEAFLYLVNLYKKKIISLCYSYTNDYQESEDLSQEVFINLFKSIDKFRGDCSLSTYLYKITVSRCLDYKRKRNFKSFLTGLLSIYKDESEYDVEGKSYVRQCIKKLPEELKVPVVLYYYLGLSHREIGFILGVSSKAVEGRIYRAKQKLKVEFEKEDDLLCKNSGMI